jgi:hypothetical protein
MKYKLKQEKGITMVALVITVIILMILTNVLIYNAQDNVYIKTLTNLYNDIDMLRDKVSAYYSEYGKIPAEIKYTNIGELKNANILGASDKEDEFYVIDLEAMQGISLNYGKDYEKVKTDKENANNYTDLYIINENSHNIFYIDGIEIKENNKIKKYYTDYIEADQTTVDLRYIDGILIPNGYFYIGKTKDSSGNESIVISNTQGETVDENKTNQYVWTKQVSKIEDVPSSIKLDTNQKEYQFIESVNTYKGYFKNQEGKVQYIVIDEEKWSEPYTKEMDYTDIKGDTLSIPEGFRVSMSPTMNIIENGLVVKDSKDNEWVWVVVPNSVFKKATSNSDYDNIKSDLIEYAKEYRKGSSIQSWNWDDEWYDGCGVADSETYTKMYEKMLSSVYTNKGFWISRYEIGDGTATQNTTTRTSNSGTSGVAVSKPNQIPYNFVTCSQAQKLASGMSDGTNKTGSLLFGIQWDLTCKFLEENSELTYADIATDSTNWGNYSNSSIKITKGKYNTDPNSSDSKWIDITSNKKDVAMLLTTGASEQTKIMNIYDFAGNEWEWTLEYATSKISYPATLRGSSYYGTGTTTPNSYRNYENITNNYERVGFRSTLY